PDCKVCLQSDLVARYHGSLVATPKGTWVVDLQRREGFVVNGTPVRHALLEDGDQLQVGEFLIRVRCEAPASPLRPPVPARDTALATRAPDTDLWLGDRHDASSQPLLALPAGFPEPLTSLDQIRPFLSQLGQLQQQMFDQFQQAMVMLFQMFSAFHKDQAGALRGDMERLRDLTHELHALQLQLAQRPPALPIPRV